MRSVTKFHFPSEACGTVLKGVGRSDFGLIPGCTNEQAINYDPMQHAMMSPVMYWAAHSMWLATTTQKQHEDGSVFFVLVT